MRRLPHNRAGLPPERRLTLGWIVSKLDALQRAIESHLSEMRSLVRNLDAYHGWSSPIYRRQAVEACRALRQSLADSKVIAEPRKPEPECDDDYLVYLQAKPAYKLLNVREVYEKMVVWCETNHYQPTRRRLVNWLNRQDRPMNGHAKAVSRLGAADDPDTSVEKARREYEKYRQETEKGIYE